MKGKVGRNLGIFIFVVIISGWVGVAVDSFLPAHPQGDSLGMGIWLALPLVTALAIILFSRGSWGEMGFRPNFKGNLKWYLAALAIFPLVTAVVLLIGSATGSIDLSLLRLEPLFRAFCGALLINFIIDIFEEAAWRGYFTSQLLKFNFSDFRLYLTVGVVWSLWHLPYYLVFLPAADIQAIMPVSRIVYAGVAFTTFLAWTVMFTELFRITKSIWPCVILHAVEDSLINLLLLSGYISIAAGKEIFISPINGLITSMIYLAVGLSLRWYRKRSDQGMIMSI